jgi:hypothetical protein
MLSAFELLQGYDTLHVASRLSSMNGPLGSDFEVVRASLFDCIRLYYLMPFVALSMKYCQVENQ